MERSRHFSEITAKNVRIMNGMGNIKGDQEIQLTKEDEKMDIPYENWN